jgi:hypothetical protein
LYWFGNVSDPSGKKIGKYPGNGKIDAPNFGDLNPSSALFLAKWASGFGLHFSAR